MQHETDTHPTTSHIGRRYLQQQNNRSRQ